VTCLSPSVLMEMYYYINELEMELTVHCEATETIRKISQYATFTIA
jgi:hypothetical protein